MTDTRTQAAIAGGAGLLERAVAYALGCLRLVTADALGRPSPCAGWDLRMLLTHLDDSLLALGEAGQCGRVDLLAVEPAGSADPVPLVREHARGVLGAWAWASPAGTSVGVADVELSAGLVAGTGAIEVCAHGWDVAVACGYDRPVPDALARELLELAPLVVTAADRPVRFAAPVPLPSTATPGERLLAYLGRRPAGW